MKDNTVSLFRTFVVVFAFSLLSNYAFSQDFKPQPLITIPGKNINIDIISPGIYGPWTDTYICWQNESDSLYTIYLKKISPFDSTNVKIFSSNYPSIKPSIWMGWDTTIHIAWQSLVNNHWQIKSTAYFKGEVGNIKSVTDSLSNNTDPNMYDKEIAWIKDSSLVFASYDSVISKQVVIDSGNCSSPRMQKAYGSYLIAYEKDGMQNKQIFLAQRIFYPTDSWKKTQVTAGAANANPSLGPAGHGGGLSFMSLIGNVWKIIYSEHTHYIKLDTTRNINCNYYNPEYLTYPILTKPVREADSFPNGGFFLVFDSDSIFANREVFVKYTRLFYPPTNNQAINISNMPGDDIKPRVFFTKFNYDTHIMIIWEHIDGDNVQLWSAKNSFRIPQDVNGDHTDLKSYSLSQNYPNPFNPSTKIRYTVPATCHVKLQIFDILGNEIALLADEAKPQGSYEVEVNAADYNMTSGIYFYRIQAGKFFDTKKLVLLK